MNKIIAALQAALIELRARVGVRFEQEIATSDRLKILVAVAGVVLIFSALFAVGSFVGGLERRYVAAQVNLIRLQAQIKSSEWPGRRQDGQILKAQLEERLWSAETPGLAEASYEQWLRTRMAGNKIEPQQILVTRIPVGPADQTGNSGPLDNLQRMTARVVMPFDSAGFMGFLADLAEAEKTVTVDRMIARAGRNPRVEINVSTFYRSPERGQ